ncbi:MAG: hypothetical protein C0518_13845 [Opitutus sp.]|nr:hypothetical protein [Opitutus sp.]
MNFRSVAPVALLAALALPASAQSAAEPEAAPQREEDLNLTLPTDEWYVPKSTLQFGVRMLSKGANVKFGNLGSVALRASGADANGNYNYDNGRVSKDAARSPYETPYGFRQDNADTAVGTATLYGEDLGNGRYAAHRVTRAEAGGPLTDVVVGEGVKYDPAYSREWAVNSASQIDGTLVRMSNFGARSDGATAEKDEGISGGVEMSLGRAIGKFGQKTEWGITAGVALNTLNAKTGGTVRSTLLTYTDIFRLSGPANGATGGPTFVDFDTSTEANDNSNETTVPIGATPELTGQTSSLVGGVDVAGNWQIKGAYFLLRVGPTIRTQLSERWGLSASVGLAGAFAGSRYSVVEQITVPDLAEPIIDDKFSTESKFLPGFYADLNVDWLATERTGLFAGVNMQQLGTYDQTVEGRTAKIDLGNAIGIRGGISIKF